MDKEIVVYTYNGIFFRLKKNGILPFATTWMDLKSIMLSEISQTQKHIYCMISHIWNLKNKHQIHRKRDLAGGCQSWGWGGGTNRIKR